MLKERIPETDHGITGDEITQHYDMMLKHLRDEKVLGDKEILKHGIKTGFALEIGPGPGYLGLEWLKQTTNTRICGAEISEDMIKLANKNAEEYQLSDRTEYINCDAQKLPFPDETFDAVFTMRSLHEWKQPILVFNEIERVLKKEGQYYLGDLRRDMNRLTLKFLKSAQPDKKLDNGLMSSINASYTIKEITELVEKSNLNNYKINKKFLTLEIVGKK